MTPLTAEPRYLVGGGSHGLGLLDALLAAGESVVGILDPGLAPGVTRFGVAVLGGDEYLDSLDPASVLLLNGIGIGAHPQVLPRRQWFERTKARGFTFASVRHPTARIARECTMGEGTHLMAGALVQWRASVGANTVVNAAAIVEHDSVVGPHTFIAPGVILLGAVTVGESVFIGAGTVVLPGVSIGARVIVGAGTVIRTDVPDGWVIAGNPAKRIG